MKKQFKLIAATLIFIISISAIKRIAALFGKLQKKRMAKTA